MKGRLKSMLTGSGNRAAAAAIAVAANPVAVETSAAGGQKRSPPAAADAPPPQFQQPLSLAQQPPPPPMSRPPAAASASAFQASFLPGRPSAASAASTSAASAPPTAQVAAADPVSSEADPVFGGGGAAAVSAFAGAAAARHATAVAANASSLQAAHAAPPNLASLPPHVLRDFSRACSAASASAVPLLGKHLHHIYGSRELLPAAHASHLLVCQFGGARLTFATSSQASQPSHSDESCAIEPSLPFAEWPTSSGQRRALTGAYFDLTESRLAFRTDLQFLCLHSHDGQGYRVMTSLRRRGVRGGADAARSSGGAAAAGGLRRPLRTARRV